MKRFYSRVPSGRDPLITNKITQIPQNKSKSVFTEAVRLNKAICCMLEDKILTEFPMLHKHAVNFVPKEGNLRITKSGQIYPGCDLSPDTTITEKCKMLVRNVEFLDKAKIKDLIVEENENEIHLECYYYPRYEENRQYLMDMLGKMHGRLVEGDHSPKAEDEKQVLEFPEEWKRVDMAFKKAHTEEDKENQQ